MLFVRINNTGERISIAHTKDMKVKDIILALGDMQYPYKLEFCGRILDESPESLITDFNIMKNRLFFFSIHIKVILKN